MLCINIVFDYLGMQPQTVINNMEEGSVASPIGVYRPDLKSVVQRIQIHHLRFPVPDIKWYYLGWGATLLYNTSKN